MKLNLNANEYKPKSFTPTTNNQYNPYGGNNYNMYNPYGGMYQQNQGFNMQQDPNMMYQQNQGFNMQQDPNMMYQQNYPMDQQNMNNNQYNQQFQQNFQNQNAPAQNTQNIPAKTVPKGIAGLPGVKTVNNTTNKPQGQTTNKATNPPLKAGDNKTPVNKPGTANTVKKPEVKVQAGKKEEIKPAVKKVEEKKVEISSVEDLSKNIEDINLDPEQILVDDSKEGSMIEVDTVRKPVNVIFIGHVDAGKSTISGNILYKSGMIDERTIEKYQRLAKANNRESWFIAYITDENEEERERGKTVEVGKAFFNTPTKRYTILDAPGHAGYVPNMLLGACQADFAGLVISAKMGEFEAGFEGEGRTREHALLAKSLGITKLIVIINKMDEDTVRWSKDRYDQIKNDLSYFLKMCGYNIEKHVSWIPISGLKGDNLVTKVDKHVCPWYEGPTLIELLDSLETPERKEDAPVRIPVLDRYKDQGVYLLGKIESGIVKYGATYTIMPSKFTFEVGWLFNTEDKGVPYAKPGECIRVSFFSNKFS